MAIIWRRVKKLNMPNALSAFEQKYGFSIPTDLKNYISVNNGGRPKPNMFVTASGTEYEVKTLLSYNEEDTENIYKVIGFFVKEYGTSVLPFAKDSSDNYYCIKDGKVIFWTQDMETYFICNTFSDFVSLLEAGQ